MSAFEPKRTFEQVRVEARTANLIGQGLGIGEQFSLTISQAPAASRR